MPGWLIIKMRRAAGEAGGPRCGGGDDSEMSYAAVYGGYPDASSHPS